MKSFRDYLKEDVVPTAVVKDGSIDLEREVVRAQINSSLASVLADPSVTPYNALMRASKVLSYFSIILPKRVYLDGEKGIEAIELRQFGDRMGMTDQGEFVKEVPGKFYLFIQYWRTHPNFVPYAATANFISSTGGMFKVAAKVVDKVELDRLIDMAEVSLSEGAEDRQALVKALAPKEDMHTALGDCDCTQGDSPSTKSAVSVMMRKKDKKLSSGELDEGRMPASVIKHKQKLASMSPDDLKKKFAGKTEQELKSMARRHGYGKDSDVYSKHVKEETVDEAMGSIKKSYAMKKMKKKVSTQVKQGLGVGKERTNTVLVTNKGDPSAAGGGGVHRIPRDKYDPTKHNLASE
jgi:hypothetical protein